MYSVNWDILIQQYLHRKARMPKFLALVAVLLSTVTDLHLQLLDYIDVKRIELSFNYQTIMMEYMLNYYWTNPLDGIYIEDTNPYSNTLYMFDTEDGQVPLYMHDTEDSQAPVYMYDVEDNNGGDDFIVWVPVAVVYAEAEMRKRIDRYKIPGKTYSIQTY